MFIKRDLSEKVSLSALRKSNPLVSVPSNPDSNGLEIIGVYNFAESDAPEFVDSGVMESTPSLAGDTATQVWVSTPLTATEKDSMIDEKVSELDLALEDSLSTLNSRYSQAEKDSFGWQRREAEAWDLDNSALTPRLDALALARGMGRIPVINKVLSRIQNIDSIYWGRLGRKQKRCDRVKNLSKSDPNFKSKLAAIVW